jgi:glycosyltransferase involved in cell wall biosynthesis
MKLLIGAAPSKLFHLEEFSRSLSKFGVECKIVNDTEYADGYPSRNFRSWISSNKKFEKLISKFQPDIIFFDRPRHFGLKSVNSKIPSIFYLRGDYWSEIKWARETIYKSFGRRKALDKWEKIGNECFSKATMILPICQYLEKIVNVKFSEKPTYVLQSGIDSSKWFEVKPMELKHPCIGLLQGATIWGKTKELLLLKKIIPALPKITFYWVGDGPYAKKILTELENFENFKWIGSLDYPDKVREYLAGIDVYALLSGIDMSPLTIQEAQLMEKPVLASNVGGISELMKNDETGFLIELGNSDKWIKKISLLLNNLELQKKFGSEGKKFIENNFSWDKLAEDFSKTLNDIVSKK